MPLNSRQRAFRLRFNLDFKPKFRRVNDAVDRKNRTVLYRTGGFTRTAVKSSMKRGQRAAGAVGTSAPRRHSGHLANLMWFNVNSGNTEVVIGPLPFPPAKRRVRPLGWPDGRALLEYGGVARLFASLSGLLRGVRRFRPFPYMRPKRPLAIRKLRELLATVPLR